MKYDKQLRDDFSVLYQARYCAQEDISIVVNKDGIIKLLEPPFSLKINTSIGSASLPKTNRDSKLVVSGSNLYLIGETWQNNSLVKFSKSSKSLNVLPLMLDERSRFCVCSFMQKIIVLGGTKNKESVNSCLAYNLKNNEWSYIASMKKEREKMSCAIFKGKLVVTGGWGRRRFFGDVLKSVEAYCFCENKWTRFSDMLMERCSHETVSIGNKMFVIGTFHIGDFEVFDSITNKFTFVKRNFHIKDIGHYSRQTSAITVGYKIYLIKAIYFKEKSVSSTFCYDVKEKSWTSEENCYAECFDYFSCAKIIKH